jgi:hypothetical protein
VIVAEALAGGVTVAGLTVQTGVSVNVVGVTWQLRSTVPVKPGSVPIVMFEDDVPPGATASGDSGAACKVKFWADANDGKVRNAANRHKAPTRACAVRRRILDFDGKDFDGTDCIDSDFTMSRFRFN